MTMGRLLLACAVAVVSLWAGGGVAAVGAPRTRRPHKPGALTAQSGSAATKARASRVEAAVRTVPDAPTAVERFSSLVHPFSASSGAYTGPFTQLSATALDGVADPDDGFGPEDKLVACNTNLVFVDLETDGTSADDTLISYSTKTQAWSRTKIISNGCPDYPNEPSLLPRDGGYTVGSTMGPVGDRLVIIGGTASDNNVYTSDDCGVHWDCYDGPQFWQARSFAPILHPTGIFPGDPMILAGGLAGETTFSVMMGLSYDFGIHWQRPECAAVANCRKVLGTPDAYGTCSDDVYSAHCYLLPDAPALPGALAYDWTTLWLFMEGLDVGGDGDLWWLNGTNFRGDAVTGGGWTKLPGGIDGGYGRKVYIRGTVPGSGCWFSTDVLAEDIWAYWVPGQVSHNNISIATTANGPWRTFVGAVPWTPRVAAALSTTWSASVAWLGSGMTMNDGDVMLPTFGDVWQIDAGVCLLDTVGGGAKVCNGRGTPNLDTVTCTCNAGFSGALCGAGAAPPSPPNAAAITFAVLIPLALVGFVIYAGGPFAAFAVTKSAATKAYEAVRSAAGGMRSGGGHKVVATGDPAAEALKAKSGGYGSL